MFGRLIRGIRIPIEFAVDKLRATAGQAQRVVESAGSRFERVAKRAGAALKNAWDFDIGRIKAGWVALTAAFAKAASVAVESVKEFARYESALLSVMSAANAAGESMLGARDAAVELSQDGFLTTTQAAQALSNFLRTGFSLEEARNLVRFAKDMAAFGNSTGDAAQAVVDFSRGVRMNSIAVMENAGWTTRLGTILGDNINLTQNAEQRTKFLAAANAEWNRVQGDSAVFLDTVNGRLAQNAARTEEARRKLGSALVPFLESLTPAIAWVSVKFGEFVRFVDTSSTILAGTFLSIGPTVKASAAAAAEGFAWLVREMVDAARWAAKIGKNFPIFGTLIGVADATGILDRAEKWADATKKSAKEWGDAVRAELRAIQEATIAAAAETYAKYDNLASTITPPPVKPGGGGGSGSGTADKEKKTTEAEIVRRLIARAEALERMIQRTAGAERDAFQRQFEATIKEIERIAEQGSVSDEGGRDAALTWLEKRADAVIKAAVDEAAHLRDLLKVVGEEERAAIQERYDAALAQLRAMRENRALTEQQRVQAGTALESHAGPSEDQQLQEAIKLASALLIELEHASAEARAEVQARLQDAIAAVEGFTGSEDLEVRTGALEAAARLREELQVIELESLPNAKRAWREFLTELERAHSTVDVLKYTFEDFFDSFSEGVISYFDELAARYDQLEDKGVKFFKAVKEGGEKAANAFAASMLGALAEVARHWARWAFARATAALATGNVLSASLFTAAGMAMAALAGAIGNSGGRANARNPNEIEDDFKRADEHKGAEVIIVLPDGIINPNDPDWQDLFRATTEAANAHNVRVSTRNRDYSGR